MSYWFAYSIESFVSHALAGRSLKFSQNYLNKTWFIGGEIYTVRHIKCYRAIEFKLLTISKNVSDKSFSVREGRHTRPPYFLSVVALKLRQGQFHFSEWNHVFFLWHYYRVWDEFSALEHKVIIVTQSIKIDEKLFSFHKIPMIIHIDRVLLPSAESEHFLLTYQLFTYYLLMWAHRNASIFVSGFVKTCAQMSHFLFMCFFLMKITSQIRDMWIGMICIIGEMRILDG